MIPDQLELYILIVSALLTAVSSLTDYDINIEFCKNTVPLSNKIKLLGVTIDNKSKFDAHNVSLCQKVGWQVNALNRPRLILPVKAKEAVCHKFTLPGF